MADAKYGVHKHANAGEIIVHTLSTSNILPAASRWHVSVIAPTMHFSAVRPIGSHVVLIHEPSWSCRVFG